MASDVVKISDLDTALQEVLGLYHADVTEAIDKATEKAAKQLVKRTKATAPVGHRGSFKKNISCKQLRKGPNGTTYVWYVKAPDYRLTHLLVHGHETRNGGRTPANPFLSKALDEVLPEFEADVKEALKNGK